MDCEFGANSGFLERHFSKRSVHLTTPPDVGQFFQFRIYQKANTLWNSIWTLPYGYGPWCVWKGRKAAHWLLWLFARVIQIYSVRDIRSGHHTTAISTQESQSIWPQSECSRNFKMFHKNWKPHQCCGLEALNWWKKSNKKHLFMGFVMDHHWWYLEIHGVQISVEHTLCKYWRDRESVRPSLGSFIEQAREAHCNWWYKPPRTTVVNALAYGP